MGGAPVPVGLASRPPVDDAIAAVREFLDAYGTPLGLVLTGDTVRGGDGIVLVEDGVIRVPYWLYLLLC